jgi:hypothetical protein
MQKTFREKGKTSTKNSDIRAWITDKIQSSEIV